MCVCVVRGCMIRVCGKMCGTCVCGVCVVIVGWLDVCVCLCGKCVCVISWVVSACVWYVSGKFVW